MATFVVECTRSLSVKIDHLIKQTMIFFWRIFGFLRHNQFNIYYFTHPPTYLLTWTIIFSKYTCRHVGRSVCMICVYTCKRMHIGAFVRCMYMDLKLIRVKLKVFAIFEIKIKRVFPLFRLAFFYFKFIDVIY